MGSQSNDGKWLLIGLVLLASLAAVAPAGAQTSGDRARLELDRRVIDLGDVPKGKDAEARFTLRNAGAAVLELRATEPACGCALADYDDRVAPGESGQLIATLLTDELRGPVTKGIELYSNDPDQPSIILTVRATVVGSVELFPLEEMFMRKREDQPWRGLLLVRMHPTESGELRVGELETSDPGLVAEARRLDGRTPRGNGLPSGWPGDWVVEVRFRDGRPLFGRRRENVSFSTGLSREPRVVVPIEFNLQAPVNLSREQIPLRSGATSATIVGSVRKGLDPAGLRVEGRPAELDVRLEREGGRLFKLHVTWKGGEPQPAHVVVRVGEEKLVLPVDWGGTP